jgi:sensor histidine kinase YesM
MNTISSLAYEGMTVEISALAESFSEVMRYVLTEGEDVVTVKAEMDFVTNYLRCIKYRFEDDFHYTVEVSDAALDARLPRLITQPVVENAVKYVTSVETPWHVSVSAHLDAGCTTVEVSDNGPGMGGPEQRHPDGLGIGLRSVKERLDGFGNGRSTMTVEGNIPRGTSVRLWITAQ